MTDPTTPGRPDHVDRADRPARADEPAAPHTEATGGPALTLHPAEPAFAPFTVRPLADVAEQLQALLWQQSAGRQGPGIVAVDGRGGSGKSSAAGALAAHLTAHAGLRVALVHTDDLAWHEPLFGWEHLLRDDVLAPLHGEHADQGVEFTPPAWTARGREGAVVIPAGTDVVLVEGTGAAQQAVAHLIDVVVWVQADLTEAERRGIERDVVEGVNGDRDEATRFWHDWQRSEVPFFEKDRPWQRADLVLVGTPEQADCTPQEHEVVTGTVRA